MIDALFVAALYSECAWYAWAALWMVGIRSAPARAYLAEAKPFVPLLLAYTHIACPILWHAHVDGRMVMLGVGLFALLLWWLDRDIPGDDDRWKRRRRKTRDAARRVGPRLVVAPVGAR